MTAMFGLFSKKKEPSEEFYLEAVTEEQLEREALKADHDRWDFYQKMIIGVGGYGSWRRTQLTRREHLPKQQNIELDDALASGTHDEIRECMVNAQVDIDLMGVRPPGDEEWVTPMIEEILGFLRERSALENYEAQILAQLFIKISMQKIDQRDALAKEHDLNYEPRSIDGHTESEYLNNAWSSLEAIAQDCPPELKI